MHSTVKTIAFFSVVHMHTWLVSRARRSLWPTNQVWPESSSIKRQQGKIERHHDDV